MRQRQFLALLGSMANGKGLVAAALSISASNSRAASAMPAPTAVAQTVSSKPPSRHGNSPNFCAGAAARRAAAKVASRSPPSWEAYVEAVEGKPEASWMVQRFGESGRRRAAFLGLFAVTRFLQRDGAGHVRTHSWIVAAEGLAAPNSLALRRGRG
jgi:hypothetical protein